jgi:hypothetical protein
VKSVSQRVWEVFLNVYPDFRIASTGRYTCTHHKQVKVLYYYLVKELLKLTIGKSNSSCLSYNAAVSLPFESIIKSEKEYQYIVCVKL